MKKVRKPIGSQPAKYLNVKRALLDGIASQRYDGLKPVPPERVLAKRMGVAHMTARRAVQELVSEGVLVRRRGRGMGTFVRASCSAPALAGVGSNALRRIAVIHSQDWDSLRASSVYYMTFLEVQTECAKRGVGVELLSVKPGDGQNLARAARDAGCQTVTVLEWPDWSQELVEAQAEGMPVIIAGPFQEMTAVCHVAPDHFQGACAVTRHLLDLGHRQVALVNSRQLSRVTVDREHGWRLTMRGLAPGQEEILYQAGKSNRAENHVFSEVKAELVAAFRERRPPSAIFARDGFFACATILALRELGLTCPGDVSVACSGRFFEQVLDMPRPTAAQVEDGALGRELVRLADELVSGRRRGPASMLLPMQVVSGETTRLQHESSVDSNV
jgi:DNA-binding LacI/PurR family transcriptional regulator/DNA-binding transcriptional regulator YhcF (GntR family)